ncbi:MAG: DMT family transporter [Cohaesibacter sp.]|jgi:drug/metabolite transporter (DMT)-like permease|nr:DMT family transporter [Cohaesibacter sp.]
MARPIAFCNGRVMRACILCQKSLAFILHSWRYGGVLSPKDAFSMSSFAGIGLKLLSTFLFAIMIAIIKYLSDTVPTGEIVFSRCFFALIPLLVMSMFQGNWMDCIRTERPWRHVSRSLVGACAMFNWFLALKYLPLPEATAISFAAPLLVVAMAAIFLKEQVRFYRWTAVAIGFVGVLIILYPRLEGGGEAGFEDTALIGVICAVIATCLMAVASILVRRMTKTEKNAAIVFYFFVTTSFFSLVSLYWGWVLPDWQTFGLLVLSGIFGGTAQIAMTQAFRLTEASLLAPFDYFNMVWALVLGIVLFAEYPSGAVMLGGSIVILAGLFVILRERRLGLPKRGEQKIRPV